MQLNRVRVPLLATALLAVLLTGCTGTLKKEAFNGTKTYAIVTIATNEDIQVNHGQAGSLLGLVQAADKDVGYSEDSIDLFKKVKPKLIKAFSSNSHFKLMPERSVLRSKAYRNIKGEKAGFLWTDYHLAKDYKFFSEKETFAKLASDLHVDGVIFIKVDFVVGFSGVNIAGLVSGGKHYAHTYLTIGVVDRNGETLWQDYVDGESEEGVATIGESANFKKLRPYFEESAGNAIKDLLAKLDE